MSEVERLSLDMQYPFQYVSDENGNLCYYTDHVELQKQCDALAAENAVLKSAISYVCDTDNQPDYQYDGMGCGIEDRGIVDRYEAAQYGWDEALERIYSEVISFAGDAETPTTDAYLNSVRAEGVEMFANFWEIHCGHEKTFIGSEAKAFAAQLRAEGCEVQE